MTLETNLKFCHDFMVAIDTNCFENYDEDKSISPYCASAPCNEFFKNRKSRLGCSMGHYFITESVFGEILQQRREYFQRAVENLNKALKPFGKEIDIPNDINFEADLRKYLDDNNIEILPHPGNEIFPKVIQRALEKKLPFKPVNENKNNKNNGSDKGFKDVLLWETLLSFDYEGKRIGKIFLITANSKDFPIDELLPEWKKFHPYVELSILQNWPDFIKEEEIIISELIAYNNIEYSTILRLFQEENQDITELPNFKKKLTGRVNSPIIEIDTDVKTRDGHIYQAKYYYDVRVNEPTLFDPDEYDFWYGDISWLTPKDLSGYKERYISKGERNITTSGLQNSSARLLPKGTVLLTSRAPVGYLAIAKQEVCTNQGFKSIVLKSGYSPEFFYYLLKNNMEYIIGMSSGSTFAEISGTQVKNLEFNVPDYDTQKKIAGVLGALDDKIELNNKINQNLEAQAQALFKSWFIDFEPFGGQMPNDWKIKTIGDVCASISETYNRKDENVVLINTSDVLNGKILTHSLVKNENLKGQFKKTFQKNDILYSEIRPINKRFAFVDIDNTYNYIASTKLMVIRPDTSKISPLILYRILKSQDLIDELQHLAETRSGTFPQITFASELAIQKIVLAPLNEQKIISNVLEVLENKIRKNIQENLRLAELRDTLLPKLISGEINVDNVKID